jgi:A/G-specific adenine glycosylase
MNAQGLVQAGWSARLLRWHKAHGRHSLPWQGTQDPYRVWLSEIMLQQTQVATVLGYYAKFLARFPSVADLAQASQDEVLALWAGLGYYSRARNLHACAKAVVSLHGGSFPLTACELQTLPGIGRSTAAAIASFCFAQRVAICDGNVKRVLARALAFEGDIAQSAHEKQLWGMATELLPSTALKRDMPRYTQAIMDLGATVCTPKNPTCLLCPMADICAAKLSGQLERFPVKVKKLKRSSQSLWLLLARNSAGAVLLQKRPVPGVWAGLHCLPLYDSEAALLKGLSPKQQNALVPHPAFTHVLTHKDLHLHVMELACKDSVSPGVDELGGVWLSDLSQVGLPAPIAKLMTRKAVSP